MNQIDFTTIFIIVIFVLPGYLAFTVYHTLYQQTKQLREIEVTYQSLLNSAGMYAVLYGVTTFLGYDLSKLLTKHPLVMIIALGFVGIIWGIAVAEIKRYDMMYKVIEKLGFEGYVQPPNLYAAVFDPAFQPKATQGYWLIFKQNNITREGWVSYTEIKDTVRLALVTEIRELDGDGHVVKKYNPEYSIIVDLTTLEGFEISYDIKKNEYQDDQSGNNAK